MTYKTILAFFSLIVGLNLLVTSCNSEECGPFGEYYYTSSLKAHLVALKISNNSELSVSIESINPLETTGEQFSINITPNKEILSVFTKPTSNLKWNTLVYACSPLPPEKVKNISIHSDIPFNSNVDITTNLVDYFDIIVKYDDNRLNRFSLTEWIDSDPPMPDEIFLLFNTAPEIDQPIKFNVELLSDGARNSSSNEELFEFMTNPITIISF